MSRRRERAQPNVVTLAGLLDPGGFVDERGVPDVERIRKRSSPIAYSRLPRRAVGPLRAARSNQNEVAKWRRARIVSPRQVFAFHGT